MKSVNYMHKLGEISKDFVNIILMSDNWFGKSVKLRTRETVTIALSFYNM